MGALTGPGAIKPPTELPLAAMQGLLHATLGPGDSRELQWMPALLPGVVGGHGVVTTVAATLAGAAADGAAAAGQP